MKPRRITNLCSAGKAFLRFCKAKTQKEYIPWYLYFTLTARCNMSCRYCFVEIPQRRSEESSGTEWNKTEICRIIDEFYAQGTRYVNFVGGEPLLVNDLEQIVSHAAKRGIITNIFTNGLLIRKKIDMLKRLPNTTVAVSFEGREETHDKDRGTGTYAKILNNIKVLHENNVKFSINYSVSKNNCNSSDLEHVLKVAKKYGATTVGINETIIKFNDNLSGEVPLRTALQEFWRSAKQLKLAGYPVQKSTEIMDIAIESLDVLSANDVYKNHDSIDYPKKFLPCLFGRYNVFLDTDGSVYPCPNLFRKAGANIYDAGVEAALAKMRKQIDCVVCRDSICSIDNYFYNMNPTIIKQAIADTFKKYAKR